MGSIKFCPNMDFKEQFTLVSGGFTTQEGRVYESAFGDCYDYLKHSNKKGKKITGHSLYLNASQYAVIDVDVKFDDPAIVAPFLVLLDKYTVKAVKTAIFWAELKDE